MRPIDILGSFVAGLITLSALSLVVAPNSHFAQVVQAFGEAGTSLLGAAKAYPANPQ
jgi:hypothetical protein